MKIQSGRRFDRIGILDSLWEEDRTLHDLLAGSEDLEEARDRLYSYLSDLEIELRSESSDLGRLEMALALSSIDVFKGIISPANEELAGFSTLAILWRAARGEVDPDVDDGFFEEFVHLIRGINGDARAAWLGDRLGEDPFDLLPEEGRRAAIRRSRFLDRLSEVVRAGVSRYPTGLDPDLIEKRNANRARILAHFAASEEDWYDPAWQEAHVLKGEEGWRTLERLVRLTGEEIASVRLAVRYGIPWGITPYYLSLFDLDSNDRSEDYQVRSQVIPPLHTVRAMIEHRKDRQRAFDFMREHDTSPIARVTRRYPTVAIFKVANTCPQICTSAIDWFEEHEGITDVLITGGDPLLLSDELLDYILARFSSMEHIAHIRIGTRIPVTLPMRVTERLATILGSFISPGRRDLSVVTHIESPYEVTPELAAAADRLRARGIRLYNQQVFTLETSRRFQTVANRIALKRVGIDPYYTFYMKGKDEHRDLLVPISRLVQERKEEARLLPGIFRTDETVFNVPGLGKNHLRAAQDRELIGIRPDGRRVYLFHPWEKGIVPVEPWVYVDVSISDYLKRLEERGEDPAEYETIWYYY